MHKGYRINESMINENNLINDNFNTQKIHEELNILDYVQPNNGKIEIDGTELMKKWFPLQSDKKIFVSHSHGDFNVVKKFAGYLDNQGIKAFIDAAVWGDNDRLIDTINRTYNKLPGEQNTFYYSEDHVITSNIDMLLIRALNRMINYCDVFIFIESENSTQNGSTYSPWIMEELELQNILAHIQSNKRVEKRAIFHDDINVTFSHDIQQNLKELTPIKNLEDFEIVLNSIKEA